MTRSFEGEVDYRDAVTFIQQHFTDGLVTVVGSGLSSAEGIPGMGPLADHLAASTVDMPAGSDAWWRTVQKKLSTGAGLEAALLAHPPDEQQQLWVARKTSELLVRHEHRVIAEVLSGARELKLTTLLRHHLRPQTGLPIVSTNYDRLVEVACEMAGYHVDTTAIGIYAGAFDPERSCMASCRGIARRGRSAELTHDPRAIVLKPHGSFDWYQTTTGPRRCSIEVEAERLIITPGLGKYRAGYNEPFARHRELANEHIRKSARLLVIGYGFNDDHLQTHLTARIRQGTPTLILTREPGPLAQDLASHSPACVCLSRPRAVGGVTILTRDGTVDHAGASVWEIDVLAKEILS